MYVVLVRYIRKCPTDQVPGGRVESAKDFQRRCSGLKRCHPTVAILEESSSSYLKIATSPGRLSKLRP